MEKKEDEETNPTQTERAPTAYGVAVKSGCCSVSGRGCPMPMPDA